MNPYEILGLNEDCTIDEIKTAYRTLSKQYHPDINNGESTKFMQLTVAYKVLSDPDKKRLYDEQGIVMDDNPNHIDNLVNERLAMIGNHWLDNLLKGNKADLKDFVINNLDNGVLQVNKVIGEILTTIEKLKGINKRLKHKSNDNIIHKIIKQRINTLKKGKLQNEKELVLIDKVKEKIMEYSYEQEKEMMSVFIDIGSITGRPTSHFNIGA